MDEAERARSLENLRLERDAIALYEKLAAIEKDPERARAFTVIASNERRHADVWASRLREAGVDVPEAEPARWRVRAILLIARIFGTRSVSDLVKALEGEEEANYAAQEGAEVAAIAADEREHAAIWKRLDAGMPGVEMDSDAVAEPGVAEPDGVDEHAPATGSEETWHRAGQSGTLRAAIFGINDGLVSNLALVMGFAGAATENQFIVLAGVAGLLAGASSMAAGEYISMQSQRELFERQIELEREELRIMPEVEQRELAVLYHARGLTEVEADLVAARLMQNPEQALDTKIREELGLDPDELGSPWGAAAYSLVAFAVGAFVPLAPFLIASGTVAIVLSVLLSLTALFVVGALVSLLTGRSLAFSGMRQMAIGGGAALLTFVVGTVIGITVA